MSTSKIVGSPGDMSYALHGVLVNGASYAHLGRHMGVGRERARRIVADELQSWKRGDITLDEARLIVAAKRADDRFYSKNRELIDSIREACDEEERLDITKRLLAQQIAAAKWLL